jgi:SAM-dependent methyltransferase
METYRALPELSVGRRVERFSDRFRADNRRALRYYRRTWVDDPLHQWSRRWEYPFVVSRLEQRSGHRGRALDAGSGLTFLPFQAAADGLVGTVDCVDVDRSLADGYRAIGCRYGVVRYQVCDLRHLPHRDGAFDVAWCVSVLEHVADPEAALEELLRVVRPGGTILLTFDISLDADRDPLALLRACSEIGRRGHAVTGSSAIDLPFPDDLVTTRSVGLERSSLPWKLPAPAYQLSCWLSGHGWPRWPPHLTFVCLEITIGSAAETVR